MSTAIIKPEWSPLTIALMVLGFIIFWPLGAAMLAYILWGEYFGGSKEKAESWVHNQREHWKAKKAAHHRCHGRHYRGFDRTGNAAFDDYREEQLRRLEEERRRLDEERAAFEEYLDNLHKARDREEFDRFMRERQNRPEDNGGGDQPHQY
ncbi:DUF2852 domain-containing protein [Pelagibacterium halotolerans]|uniref:DUF2852 domain-containing protein n=1 Tax=Pelagibacterium halotolerans TaxID=531813 RepID=UPI00384F91D8